MFTQDHKSDFDAVLRATDPFALVRFGDGEVALIHGVAHKSADAWETSGSAWLRDELIASLRADLPGYFVGLPTPCCLASSMGICRAVRVPKTSQTFATLFMHGNLPRFPELLKLYSNAVVISGDDGDIQVPRDGVAQVWDVDRIVDEMLEIRGRPILIAAGPCANLLILRYWKRQKPELRVPVLDVGSPLDVSRGRINRHYHGKMNDHHCTWGPIGSRSPPPPERPTQRLKLGRPKVSKVQRVQRRHDRVRIGKP